LVSEGQSVTQGGFDPTAGVREGDVVGGKYRVERVLGIGGMGVVVAAHHIQLDEKVALKFLLPEALGNSEAVARFAREARAAVKIKSEHVARVTDVGTLPSGAPYMVMEYLEGGDLAAWLKQRGALPIEQAVEFVLQACVAVADAHALGIVHRDLKPANLFCIRRSDGQLSIKVLDFGISKLTSPGGSASGPLAAQGMAFTRTSVLMGSPLYMSPEQMRSSKDVDAQTDIWALGMILFELMAGHPAFLADSVTELAIKVANEPTPPLRSFRPEVPSELEAIVFNCLQKDRSQRYRNVAQLALALLPFAPKRAKASVERISGIIQAAGLSAGAFAMPPSPQSADTQASAGTLPPLGRTTLGLTGRKTALGVGIVAAVALAAVVGFMLLSFKRVQTPREDARVVDPRAASPAETPSPARIPTAVNAQPSAMPESSVTATVAMSAQPTPLPPAVRASQIAKPTAPLPRPAGGGPPRVQPTPSPAPSLTASAPSATAHTPDCNPPYVIDSAGDRQYKPECL
jgi:serine/threonine protein kinase